jgi:hypothetical protein
VQVLTHLKEKLQFVQGENQIQKGKLAEVESDVAQVSEMFQYSGYVAIPTYSLLWNPLMSKGNATTSLK